MLQVSRKAGQINRTRARIEKALVDRLVDEDLADISITRLCEAAEVGRQTFYRHYNDKDDVLRFRMRSIFRDYLKTLKSEELASYDLDFVNLQTLRFWKAHEDFFILTANESVQVVIFSELDRMMEALLGANLVHTQLDPFLRAFRHWGMKGVLLAWAKSGMRQSPEEINAILKSANGSFQSEPLVASSAR